MPRKTPSKLPGPRRRAKEAAALADPLYRQRVVVDKRRKNPRHALFMDHKVSPLPLHGSRCKCGEH